MSTAKVPSCVKLKSRCLSSPTPRSRESIDPDSQPNPRAWLYVVASVTCVYPVATGEDAVPKSYFRLAEPTVNARTNMSWLSSR
jgi:hypothetical protein